MTEVAIHVLPPVIVAGQPLPKLTDAMAAAHVPGVAIAVLRGGQVDWAMGFGTARPDGSSVTARTLFQAGRVSQFVTAVGVMRLAAAGTIKLDEDANATLKEFKLPEPQGQITVRMLLNGTAGLQDGGGRSFPGDKRVPSPLALLQDARSDGSPFVATQAAPGARHGGLSASFDALQLLVQDATGKRFSTVMDQQVFRPFGMERSSFLRRPPQGLADDVATPYAEDGQPLTSGPHGYPAATEGLWSTPADLAILLSKLSRGRDLLPERLEDELFTPALGRYALGIDMLPFKAYVRFGSTRGYSCALVLFRSGEGAVVMANAEHAASLLDGVLRSVAQVYAWPALAPPTRTVGRVEPAQLADLTGVYRFAPGMEIKIDAGAGSLQATLTGQRQAELLPENPTRFFYRDVDAVVDFQLGGGGKATQLILHQNGRNLTANRVG